ncbi:NADH dehydrogenase [ubiquinone] 1 alpha subcomplex assembly factor 3 [Daktulosphaira vitifoliae]|uniref:NADH dehydrogenase [ubiquinone] 1 alpha subcomplex assembly factor 3 n=1 Tax=Daktulosphaira vitifoliae TaxID=58002 RepID=UPI0021A9DE97|nr:NADH dehydrogenase [ubiquinone] 1 alpha subcomplex assembly factor 3 [Daktulosphaira vitifoliae]
MFLKNLGQKLCKSVKCRYQTYRFVGAYDNDGKTHVTMMNNNNIKDGIMISGYSQFGFRLNNNFQVLGPILCFPNSILAWYIDSDKDINEDSLSLLFHLEPMPSVVVLGIGDNMYRKSIDKVVWSVTKKYNCNIEVLPIDAALATYNFIVSEQRHVVGAFIPPKNIPVIDDDIISANARHKVIYGKQVNQDDIWVNEEEQSEIISKNYKEFAETVAAEKAAKIETSAKYTNQPKDPKKLE